MPELLAMLDAQRKSLRCEGDVTEILPNVTRRRAADGQRAIIDYSCLTEKNADEEIATQIAFHASLGVSFEWKLYSHDTPVDLDERLRRAGFEQGDEEAVMVAESSLSFQSLEGAHVRRVESQADLRDFRYVAESVFRKDYSLTTGELAKALDEGTDEHAAFVAYTTADDPVSIGRVYTHPRSLFAGLYGGGTLPDFRGKGHYKQVVSARAAFALAQGARYLMVDALPTSRPLLERAGFYQLGTTTPYSSPQVETIS